MANLFVYGSLQFADVMFAVTGAWLRSTPAQLVDYRVFAVRGRPYPALVRAPPGSIARGRLYRGLRAPALRRLDAFEGAWYVRRRVAVSTARGRAVAFVYVWHRAQHKRLADAPWDVDCFRVSQRRRFVAHWRGRSRRIVAGAGQGRTRRRPGSQSVRTKT